jgi:hypothetical protein
MAQSASRLRNFLSPVALSVAAGLMLIGVLVLTPPWWIGTDLFRQPSSIVGFFLIYSAFVIAANVRGVKFDHWLINFVWAFLFGGFAAFGVGCINVALAFHAVTARPIPFAVIALLLPAFMCFAYSDSGNKQAEKEVKEAPDQVDKDFGKSGSIAAGILVGVLVAFLYCLAFAVLIVAMIGDVTLYVLLNLALIGHRAVDFAHLPPLSPLLLKLALKFSPLFIVILVIIPLMILVPIAVSKYSLAGRRDANRDLTQDEIQFIEKCRISLLEYAWREGYMRRSRTMFWITVGAYSLTAAFVLWLFYLTIVSGMSTPASQLGEAFSIVVAPQPWASGILLFVALFAGLPAPAAFLSLISPTYRRRATWWYVSGQINGQLARFVRLGRIGPHVPFSPSDFLKLAGRTLARSWAPAFLLVSGLTAFFWYHDGKLAASITDNGIDVVNYWTLERTHFAFPAVEQVALHCSYDDKGGRFYAYEIDLPRAYSVNLTQAARINHVIGPIDALDSRLRAAKVRFVFAQRKPLFQDPEPDYDPACVRKLALEFKGSDQKKIAKIFHLDGWRANSAVVSSVHLSAHPG